MQIPKDMVLDFLRNIGQGGKAQQAADELPDHVDTEKQAGLLERFGVDPAELLAKLGGVDGIKEKLAGLGGSGALGGLGDKLGGLGGLLGGGGDKDAGKTP